MNETRPLKLLAELVSGAGFPPALQGQSDKELPFLKVADLGKRDSRGYFAQPPHTIDRATAHALGADLIAPHTPVLAKIGAAISLRRVGVTQSVCCIDNNMVAAVPRRGTHARYLYYVLSLLDPALLLNGGAVPNINMNWMRHTALPWFRFDVQGRIADYLDHETAEIDALIADLKEGRRVLVERLMSQLRSLTSPQDGIDGVDQPLGTLATFIAGGTPDSNNRGYWSDDGTGVAWVAISDMSRRESVRSTSKQVTSSGMAAAGLRLLTPGTILLAMYASVGEVAKLEISAVTNQAILGITPGRDLNGDYLIAHLRSRQAALVAEARSSTQANLNAHQIRHLKLWRPSRAAQDRIADEIAGERVKHRAQLADIDAAILLANERRAALITAAVTGQIDVTTKHPPVIDSIQTAIDESR